MKFNCANVIKMSKQCKKASAVFIIPNLYLVVVTTRNKKWLRTVKADASNRAFFNEMSCGNIVTENIACIPSCSSNLSNSVLMR